MLEKIILHNFQKHECFELTLDPYVTVITGASNLGKSSIFRALRWISLNQTPRGVNYSRRGQDQGCEVELILDKGIKIKRIKSDSKNEYILNGSKYKVPGGNSPPEDIAKILNVSALNFSKQIDGPFWFTLTPGQISKELNTIINLDKIDSSLAKAASRVKSTKTEVKIFKERLKEARKRKKELAWVENLNSDLIVLEEIEKELTTLQNKHARISEILKGVIGADIRLQSLSQAVLEAEETVLKFPLNLITQLSKVESLIRGVDQTERRLKEAKVAEEDAQEELEEKTKGICPLCNQPMEKLDEYKT